MGVEALDIPKRIDRSTDEKIYQPKIHANRIRELYAIGQQYKLPMTVILDLAIQNYIEQLNQQEQQ